MSDQLLTNHQSPVRWKRVLDLPLTRQKRPLPAAQADSDPGKTARTSQPRRLGMFAGIGAVVFVLGTAFQGALIAFGDGRTASYLWQAVFSIELSFALNRWLT